MNAIAQASTSPAGPQLDNRRVLAAAIDLVLIVAGGVLLAVAAAAVTGADEAITAQMRPILVAWALYYYFALESGAGQTVGKKLMNLRVVRADGTPAGMREIAIRTLLRVVDGLFVYVVGLIVMLATGERRQRLGDLAAGTKVIDASAAPGAVALQAAVPEAAPAEGAPAEVPAEVPAESMAAPELPEAPEAEDLDADAASPDPEPEQAEVIPLEPAAEAQAEEPAVEEPEADEPAAGLRVVEEPSAVEPAIEEPPAVEPAIEEPSAEEQPAETEGEDVTVRPMETVSPIDMVMDADEDRDEPAEHGEGREQQDS